MLARLIVFIREETKQGSLKHRSFTLIRKTVFAVAHAFQYARSPRSFSKKTYRCNGKNLSRRIQSGTHRTWSSINVNSLLVFTPRGISRRITDKPEVILPMTGSCRRRSACKTAFSASSIAPDFKLTHHSSVFKAPFPER
jgi:hypothetical protein